jgi:hypothetical protein
VARSSYIYVVQDSTGKVLAAFTVKHELASWLDEEDGRRRNPTTREDMVGITRVRDGKTVKDPWTKYELVQMLNPRTLEPVI